jgi:hypothetical protein
MFFSLTNAPGADACVNVNVPNPLPDVTPITADPDTDVSHKISFSNPCVPAAKEYDVGFPFGVTLLDKITVDSAPEATFSAASIIIGRTGIFLNNVDASIFSVCPL